MSHIVAVWVLTYIATYFWWKTLGGLIERKATFYWYEPVFEVFLQRIVVACAVAFAYYLWTI